jgi:drug/metabolite transporter (DMT)-like permease
VKGVSTVLAFAGVAIAFGPAALTGEVGPEVLFGDGLMMLAVLCGAGYSVFARPFLVRFGPLFVTALGMLFGLALLTWSIGGGPSLPALSAAGWGAVIFLGTVGGALQFALYTWALKWIAPSRTAIYLTLNPISAMALATLLLDEALTLDLVAGFVLVSAGIVLANRPDPAKAVRSPS